MKYIVTNFAYGHGPYLRTTELALAVNEERKLQGKEEFGILVPWVYGEKQKRIMLEEFPLHAERIVLDEALGSILKQVFYGDSTYEEALLAWVRDFDTVSQEAHKHLSGEVSAETLSGTPCTLMESDIVLELARAPRIAYRVAPVYGATFGHISEILRETLGESLEHISADRSLVEKALPIAQKLEDEQRLVGLAEPGTFSYKTNRVPKGNEILIPPTTDTLQPYAGPALADGIFVTITGIPGLERLYKEAQSLGLALYTNAPEQLTGGVKALPAVVASDAIKLHFARSGWGSIWLSMLLGKAIIVPEFDTKDDPEIYFNNLCVEELGIGIIYRGEPLAELIEKARGLEVGIQERNNKLREQYGTLDGNVVMARRIVSDLGESV